jgi:hypothetical protein
VSVCVCIASTALSRLSRPPVTLPPSPRPRPPPPRPLLPRCQDSHSAACAVSCQDRDELQNEYVKYTMNLFAMILYHVFTKGEEDIDKVLQSHCRARCHDDDDDDDGGDGGGGDDDGGGGGGGACACCVCVSVYTRRSYCRSLEGSSFSCSYKRAGLSLSWRWHARCSTASSSRSPTA